MHIIRSFRLTFSQFLALWRTICFCLGGCVVVGVVSYYLLDASRSHLRIDVAPPLPPLSVFGALANWLFGRQMNEVHPVWSNIGVQQSWWMLRTTPLCPVPHYFSLKATPYSLSLSLSPQEFNYSHGTQPGWRGESWLATAWWIVRQSAFTLHSLAHTQGQ